MSRTAKWEHRTDSHNVGRRLERTARPAGRHLRIIEAELAADDEPSALLAAATLAGACSPS